MSWASRRPVMAVHQVGKLLNQADLLGQPDPPACQPSPNEVDGNPGDDDEQPRPCVHRLHNQQIYHDCCAKKHVEAGDHGISKGSVRPFRVGSLAPQHEQANNGEHVKEQSRENHIIEQVAIFAGKRQQARPRALQNQPGRRDAIPVRPPMTRGPSPSCRRGA